MFAMPNSDDSDSSVHSIVFEIKIAVEANVAIRFISTNCAIFVIKNLHKTIYETLVIFCTTLPSRKTAA